MQVQCMNMHKKEVQHLHMQAADAKTNSVNDFTNQKYAVIYVFVSKA